jgi:hypothetical protein
MSLAQSIEDIAKIHSTERSNSMDREVAAKALGYSGISGRSATVLANLIQYGLLEKAGKNEVRVSKRAVDILHPPDNKTREAALRAAASEPELFQKIAGRFTDGLPSDNALHSFLVREEYTDAAIPAAIRAFHQTWEFLENAIEKGSHVPPPPNVVESQSKQSVEGNSTMAGGQVTGAGDAIPGRGAEIIKASAAGGADLRFVKKVILLGGSLGNRAQVDEAIATLQALRPMVEEAETADNKTETGEPE